MAPETARAPLIESLRSAAWREVVPRGAIEEVDAFLRQEAGAGYEILPPRDQIFAALDAVEPADVRVVILGQDPYPTPGHAHGLAFSYRGDGGLPRSLRNIFAEVEEDTGVGPSGSGDLTPWARQGVLLLNAVLTVRAGEAGSHRRRGWEAVTDAILEHLAASDQPLVFLLWGNDARKKARLLGSPHVVLEAGHPSPLSIRYFRGCRHFSQANSALGEDVVDWGV